MAGIAAGDRGIVFRNGGQALKPDGSLTDVGKLALAQTRRFREGLYLLLGESERPSARIAIHASSASRIAARLMGIERSYRASVAGWNEVVRASGMRFDWVDSPAIEAGELQDREYALLILPQSLSLSPSEALHIRRFVREGGALLGDLRAGILNDRCRRMRYGLLDDVFGVTRRGDGGILRITTDIKLKGESAGADASIGCFDLFDSSIVPTTAAAGGRIADGDAAAPAFLSNAFGRGKAVYLNAARDPVVESELPWPARPEDVGILTACLQELDGVAEYQVLTESGKVPRIQLDVFVSGPDRYIAIRADGATAGSDARLPLRSDYWRYDLISGVTLGRGSELLLKNLRAEGRIRLVALLAKGDGKPRVAAGARARVGERVTYRVTPPSDSGRRVYRVEVFDAAGRARKEYGSVLSCRETTAEGAFYSALNDVPGVWRICITDVVTRENTTAEVQLRRE